MGSGRTSIVEFIFDVSFCPKIGECNARFFSRIAMELLGLPAEIFRGEAGILVDFISYQFVEICGGSP